MAICPRIDGPSNKTMHCILKIFSLTWKNNSWEHVPVGFSNFDDHILKKSWQMPTGSCIWFARQEAL